MSKTIETTESKQPEPRKLEKPARQQELDREQLVTYTDEAGGGGIAGGGGTAPLP